MGLLPNKKDKLAKVFAHQEKQLLEYHEIVDTNGFLFDHNIPVKYQTIEGEETIRHSLLHFMEEIAEAQEVYTHEYDQNPDKLWEEMADALHFLVEVALVSGTSPVELCWWLKPPGMKKDMTIKKDLLEEAFKNDVSHLPQSEVIEGEVYFLWPYYYSGLALNQLKNKTWKQKLKHSDMPTFRLRLKQVFAAFIVLCKHLGLDAQSLYNWYSGKAEINSDRRESGY